MYKTYHYDNMPQPVRMTAPAGEAPPREAHVTPVHKESAPKQPVSEHRSKPETEKNNYGGILNGIFGDIKSDDIILLVIIFILLLDDCDDKLLLIVLGFIFFSGLGE